MDSTLLFAVATAGASFLYSHQVRRKNRLKGRQVGTRQRVRVRRSVESVRNEIGDILFRRSYRMSYESFQELHRILSPHIRVIHRELMEEAAAKRRERLRRQGRYRNRGSVRTNWRRFVPNGSIDTTVRLAMALRFFAGGSIYDIAPLYGVGRPDAFSSVSMGSKQCIGLNHWI